MKITLEPMALAETEVLIRGDLASEEVTALLQYLQGSTGGKLILYKDEEQFILDAKEVIYAETRDSRVMVITESQAYESRQRLFEIKAQLGSRSFVQINKGTLVNIDRVKSIQAEFSGNYLLRLKDRPEKLTISRKYFKEFKDAL